MAAESAQCVSSTSMLWHHFVAVDVTNTFRTSFAPHLSGVSDRRTFASQLAALMRQWRTERWEETFIAATHNISNVGKQRGRIRNGDDHIEAQRQQEQERNLAMYYESIRVQRLMDEVLLFPLLEECDLEEKTLSFALRRRCRLIQVVDAVWSAATAAAVEFLLPVAEWQAPQYYRRVKRPVSVGSLYCSVWDAEVEDYTDLKALLVLMRSNCELYNGPGSPLLVACQELVKVGSRAAREAQTQEEEKKAREVGLVIPHSLLLDTPNKTASGGVDAMLVTTDELTKMFPPRHEAVECSLGKRAAGAHANTTLAANHHITGSSGESRPVLRLAPHQKREERGVSGGRGLVDDAARPRLRLRLTTKSVTEATETTTTTTGGVTPNKEVSIKKKGQRKSENVEYYTAYSISCDRCGYWRDVSEKPDPPPVYWECSFAQLKCAPLKRGRKKGGKVSKEESVAQSSVRKTKSSKKVTADNTRTKNHRGDQSTKTATKQKGRSRAAKLIETSEGEDTPLQAHTPKKKRQTKEKEALREPPRKRGRRARSSSSSSSLSSSSSSSSSQGAGESDNNNSGGGNSSNSSSSSSSSSSTGSSSSSSSEAPTPRRPVKRGRGRPPLKAAATAKKTAKPTKKKSTKTRHRGANGDTSDEGSGDGDGGGRFGSASRGPVLTTELLDELEAEMDELEAIPVHSANPKEILSRLQNMEKKLR